MGSRTRSADERRTIMFAKPLFEKKAPRLDMNLQMFAEDNNDDDSDDDQGDDTPDLVELLKNPEFKKQYEADMKGKLGKRLKKYKDVDLEEYERLKQEAAGKKSTDDEEDDNKSDSKLDEYGKRLARAERKEKRAAVKEYAMENKFNAKLAAKLISIDEIELDDDGEPTNLEELFEDLAEEFPEYFTEKEEEEESSKSGYGPGVKQKNNSRTKKPDGYEVGKSSYARIQARRNKNRKGE